MRTCSTCKRKETEVEFVSNPHSFACKDCKRAVDRAYYLANAERIRKQVAEHYWASREDALEQRRDYYQRNKTKMHAAMARYTKANPHAKAAVAGKRRAAKLGTPNPLTTEQWSLILESFCNTCAYCGRADCKLTIDHVQALARGGSHSEENVVPACFSCNSTKQARGVLAMVNRPWGGVFIQG